MSRFNKDDIAYIRVKIITPDSLGATVEVVDDKGRPWDNGPQWYADIHMVAKKQSLTAAPLHSRTVKKVAAHIKRSKKATKRKPGRPAKRISKRKARR